jgi:hypothetical protein
VSDPHFLPVWTSPPLRWQILVLLTYPLFLILFFRMLKRNADLWAMVAIFSGTALTGSLYWIYGDQFARFAALYQMTLVYVFGKLIELTLAFVFLRLIGIDRFYHYFRGKLK